MGKKKKRIKVDNPDSELYESIHDLLDSMQMNDTFGILKDSVKVFSKLSKSARTGINKKEPVVEVVTDEKDFDKSNNAKEVN